MVIGTLLSLMTAIHTNRSVLVFGSLITQHPSE